MKVQTNIIGNGYGPNTPIILNGKKDDNHPLELERKKPTEK